MSGILLCARSSSGPEVVVESPVESPSRSPDCIPEVSQVALGALGGRELLGCTRVALVLEVLGGFSMGEIVLTLIDCSFNSLSIFFLAKNNLISLGSTTVDFTFFGCLCVVLVSLLGLVPGLAWVFTSGKLTFLGFVSGLGGSGFLVCTCVTMVGSSGFGFVSFLV